ncbi:M14 family zinc carboxypeptidase [Solicola gregarius]|uniref:Peptidase M14 domain-containing protein n=1 Tax=Solicola gregarius TaxID=2908642 RepID=A0AA46THV6_9ACTN|nr:M14 family zinc carboxypeptidase [Solicola gregarius]UYM05649.1 hypothetical protein L0C25_00775 [Solicola gregarius]
MTPTKTARYLLAATFAFVALLTPLLTGGVSASVLSSQAPAAGLDSPEDYFGFEMGAEGKLARWDDIVAYYKMIADESDRVLYEERGTTSAGLPFPVLTVSSPENLENLDRIKEINQRLADPRGLPEDEAKELAAEGKPVYMLAAAIHSTEVGTAQSIPNVLYRLATENSTTIDEILDDSVVLIVPAENPDGTKWVGDYFNETAGTKYDRTYPDLYHKYTGHDDNRDWFMLTQKESRISVGLQNEYRPQVVHNMHQMGPTGPRLFTPPYLAPNDPNIDPITVQQTNSAGMEMTRGLTAEGKKGVLWGDIYDYWTPSRHYMAYHGAPRLLTEAASAKDLAYTYESEDGKPLGPQEMDTNFIEPYDKSTWSLSQIVDYLDTAAFAGMSNVATYSDEWLYNFYRTQRRAVRPGPDKPFAFVVPGDQRDPFATYEMLELLQTGDVELKKATESFTAGGEKYAAGSWIVEYAQPFGRWAKTLLEVQHYPNLREYPGGPPQPPYDVTAQTLPMLLGVTVDTLQEPFDATTTEVSEVEPASPSVPESPGGAYLVGPQSYGSAIVMAELQQADAATLRSTRAFSADGRRFPAGTFIVEPTEEAQDALATASEKTGIPVYGVDAAPRVPAEKLKAGTRIGLYRGIDNMPGGWMKWLFEQYETDFTEVAAQDFDGDLNDQYDTIVFPAGISKEVLVEGLDRDAYPKRWSWAYGVGQAGWRELRRFVRNGGTLLTIGDSVDTAKKLFSLPIEPALPDDSTKYYSPGSILRQRFDTSDPIAWGMRRNTPVWFGEDDQAYEVSGGDVVSSFPASGKQLRSGWLIGGEYLNGKANVVAHDIGKGTVVTFGSEPTFRTWSREPGKLLFNAIYHGPSTHVSAHGVETALRQ